MPDKRKHRGAHPADSDLFAPSEIPKLKQALRDLSWLLSRGYAERSSLKLVGDRYRLRERQRLAISRCACSRQALELRQSKTAKPADIQGNDLVVDGFNVLITIESALAGGLVFEGVDGCYRDLASVHGSYKQVTETGEAIFLAGKGLASLAPRSVRWLLDRPVSNSGKLKALLLENAAAAGWPWEVDLFNNPDQQLIHSQTIVASSDSMVIDGAKRWFNLSRFLIDGYLPGISIIRLK